MENASEQGPINRQQGSSPILLPRPFFPRRRVVSSGRCRRPRGKTHLELNLLDLNTNPLATMSCLSQRNASFAPTHLVHGSRHVAGVFSPRPSLVVLCVIFRFGSCLLLRGGDFDYARSVVIASSFASTVRDRRVSAVVQINCNNAVPSFVVVVVGDAGCKKFGFWWLVG